MAEYLHYTPHVSNSSYVGVVFRGLMSRGTHDALRTGGAALPTYYTFGVLLLSTLDPLTLMQAFKAHQDYTNPDITKLLSKNASDRLLTQVQAYYASLSPLLVAGFNTPYTGDAVPACFKDTFVSVLPAETRSFSTTVIPSSKRMGGTGATAGVPGGLATDLNCLTLGSTIDAKCHASGVAKSFLITGHAVAQDGSKLVNAECDAAYAGAFAVDLTGSVSDNTGNGDMKMENTTLTQGKVYSFQDLAIAPNFSLAFTAA